MPNKIAMSSCFAALFIVLASITIAKADDSLLLNAQTAYQNRDLGALQLAGEQLKAEQNILAPYADYWLMLLNLSESGDEEVQTFLSDNADYPFADKLRGEYLKKLGKTQNWALFNAEVSNYHRDDVGVACYVIEARIADKDAGALDGVKPLWLSASEQPANCENLFDGLLKNDLISQDDVLARFRLSLQESKNGLAKNVGKYLSGADTASLKLIDRIFTTPKMVFDKKPITLKIKIGRELNLYAIERIARTEPLIAVTKLQKIQASLSDDERAYSYGRLAFHAARLHLPEANNWFAQSDIKWLDKDQRAWKTRAAMQVGRWDVVLLSINDMPIDQQQESTWRYWKARALKQQKQITAANQLFSELANEPGYYGLLALEDLGLNRDAPLPAYKPTTLELEAVKNEPAIRRALALQNLDFRFEAKSEWAWALQDVDDKTLITAALIAQNAGWNDVSINTADKTKLVHNYELRYPLHYKDMMQAYAAENDLDESWVYGLIRQESRFISVARSQVGASGLMQIMPATAKWIAKRLGDSGFKQTSMHELDTNIRYGTHYLKYTLDAMNGQQAMATAAYNAGPGRPKRWATANPLEGAIYVDSIPLMETRDYVRKVLANAQYYAQRLGLKPVTLKNRLGVVAGTGAPPDIVNVEIE